MAKRTKFRVPSYRLHKPSGQAVVTLSGKDFYLGPWQTQVSRDEYDRLIAEWVGAGRQLPPDECSSPSVGDLILAFWRHAEQHYRKNGEPTSEVGLLRLALRPLRRLYGRAEVREFGPLALKTVRQEMVEAGLSRNVVNSHTRRIRRVFRWGVENELVPPAVLQALSAVKGLQKGRTEARDSAPVQPVLEEHARALREHTSPQVYAMVELQLVTGMRPGEVVQMRTCDLNTSEPTWTYIPASHKTEHHDKARLKGARFVSASEPDRSRRLSESVVKELTGGDVITARFLHKEFFEFQPTFKIWFAANHKPRIRGAEHAIWRRIRLIPFDVTIPDEDQDQGLPDKLREELPGILAWAVQGCLDWQAQGLGPPGRVVEATQVYREEMDTLAGFLEECCVEIPGTKTPIKDLYAAYTGHCEENNERASSKLGLGEMLEGHGFRRAKGAKGVRCHEGI